ncbi:MAG: hypothetical protein Q4A19_08160 [Johnsonella sp.]|nr:hypothetical protein [Johnsonella sp.]
MKEGDVRLEAVYEEPSLASGSNAEYVNVDYKPLNGGFAIDCWGGEGSKYLELKRSLLDNSEDYVLLHPAGDGQIPDIQYTINFDRKRMKATLSDALREEVGEDFSTAFYLNIGLERRVDGVEKELPEEINKINLDIYGLLHEEDTGYKNYRLWKVISDEDGEIFLESLEVAGGTKRFEEKDFGGSFSFRADIGDEIVLTYEKMESNPNTDGNEDKERERREENGTDRDDMPLKEKEDGFPSSERKRDEAENKDKSGKTDTGNTSPGRTHSERSGSGGDTGKRASAVLLYTGGKEGIWKMEDGNPEKWSFILRSGIRLHDVWADIRDEKSGLISRYHFNKEGYIDSGWYWDGFAWYYLREEHKGSFGAMVRGWLKNTNDKKWYYLDPGSGVMSTGWRLIEGKYYFFSPEKAGASYRYHSESGRPEYLSGRPYGSMYEGEKTPDGYEVDEEGAWRENAE